MLLCTFGKKKWNIEQQYILTSYQCSVHKKFFWSSDNMSDDSEQIMKHIENIIRLFSLNICKKIFRWSHNVLWFWTNHHTFYKIISNVWWANGFLWMLPVEKVVLSDRPLVKCWLWYKAVMNSIYNYRNDRVWKHIYTGPACEGQMTHVFQMMSCVHVLQLL